MSRANGVTGNSFHRSPVCSQGLQGVLGTTTNNGPNISTVFIHTANVRLTRDTKMHPFLFQGHLLSQQEMRCKRLAGYSMRQILWGSIN